MHSGALATYFRHRSSLLLLLAGPIVYACVRGGSTGAGASALGLLLVAAGVALRLQAIRRIGRGARVHRAHASAGLTCSGPYAWTRNPLYLAAGFMVWGFGSLAGAGVLAAILGLLTLAVYTPVILHEERILARLIGPAYLRYLMRVPRWLGPRYPMHDHPAGSRVAWREVLRREKYLLPGSFAAAGAILLFRSAAFLRPLDAVSDSHLAAGIAGGFLAAAVSNSWKIEQTQRRRHLGPGPVAMARSPR